MILRNEFHGEIPARATSCQWGGREGSFLLSRWRNEVSAAHWRRGELPKVALRVCPASQWTAGFPFLGKDT